MSSNVKVLKGMPSGLTGACSVRGRSSSPVCSGSSGDSELRRQLRGLPNSTFIFIIYARQSSPAASCQCHWCGKEVLIGGLNDGLSVKQMHIYCPFTAIKAEYINYQRWWIIFAFVLFPNFRAWSCCDSNDWLLNCSSLLQNTDAANGHKTAHSSLQKKNK